MRHNLRNKFLPFSIVDKSWHRESINYSEDIIPETNNMPMKWQKMVIMFEFQFL